MLVGPRIYMPEFGTRTVYDSDSWDVHASTAHPNFPETELQFNDLLGACTIAYSSRASHSYIYGTISTADDARTIDLISLLGTARNVVLGVLPQDVNMLSNQARLRIDLSHPLADRVYVGIASISSLVNLTGSASDISGPIDVPVSPQPIGYVMTKLVATNPALDTVVLVTFQNHNATERSLLQTAGSQRFRVHARFNDGADLVPSVRLKLKQGGSLVADLGLGVDSNLVEKTSEGWIFQWTNLGVALPSATGQISVEITGTSAGGRTPEIVGVEWYAGLATVDYDSGWNDATRQNHFWNPEIVIPAELPAYFLIELSDYVTLALDSATYSPAIVGTYAEVNGHSQAGRFVGSGSIFHDLISPGGLNWRRTSDVPFARSRMGSMRSNRVALQYKEADILLPFIPNSELLEIWEAFFDTVGMKTPFLFVPDPTRPECYWVVCTSWNSDHVGYFVGDGDSDERYDLAFSIAEHQAMLMPRG